jgi:hypothetical protein
VVDAFTPGVPLRQYRLVEAVGEVQAVQFTPRQFAHRRQIGFNLRQHIARQCAAQERPEHPVVGVLVPQRWGLLMEQFDHSVSIHDAPIINDTIIRTPLRQR